MKQLYCCFHNKKQPELIFTQSDQKYKSSNTLAAKKIKNESISSNKSHEKQQNKHKYQLYIKGKTINQQKYQKTKQNKPKSVTKTQTFRQQNSLLEQSSPSSLPLKLKQNLLSNLQASKDKQLLTFYHSNVFTCHNKHNRFNKILKTKYCNQIPKTQYYPQQSHQSFESQNFTLKHNFNKSQKIEVKRSSLICSRNQVKIQSFEPRLKYKKRPKSVNNSKKYRMSSFFVKFIKNSFGEREKVMSVQNRHIEPLKTQHHKTFDDEKIVCNKQFPIQIDHQTRKIVIKTQSSSTRNKIRVIQNQILVTSARGINPWSDEQSQLKNIYDEQINVKFLS